MDVFSIAYPHCSEDSTIGIETCKNNEIWNNTLVSVFFSFFLVSQIRI